MLDPGFSAFALDEILIKLLNPSKYPEFQDPRNCLVLWARPTEPVKKVILTVQEKLRAVFRSKL
jgi:hypothetical protein